MSLQSTHVRYFPAEHVAKLASRFFYCWSFWRNNNLATNHQVYTSRYDSSSHQVFTSRYDSSAIVWEDDNVPPRGPLLGMSNKPVTTKAATATRAGGVRRRLGTLFSKRSSVPAAEDDPRHSILQLNTEELTANKISVIEHLATRTVHSSSSYRRPTAQLQTSY